MTTTEIVLRDGVTTIAVPDEFAAQYPVFAQDEAMQEMLAEALDGVELGPRDLPRLRVPSGGGMFFQVVVDGEEKAVNKITGVPVHIEKQRVFWLDPEPKGQAPDCMSADGNRPVAGGTYAPDGERAAQNPTGLCKQCPMAQKGSDLKGGKGAACKDQRLIFLVEPAKMLPRVVTAPPSSIRSLTEFMIDLINTSTAWWGVEVEIGLAKAANSAGIEFGRLTFKSVRKLSPEEVIAVRDYGAYIKAMVKDAAPGEFIDVASTVQDMAGGMDVDAEGGIKLGGTAG